MLFITNCINQVIYIYNSKEIEEFVIIRLYIVLNITDVVIRFFIHTFYFSGIVNVTLLVCLY